MDNVFEQTAAFTRLWQDMMTKMWGAGMSWQPTQPPPEAARMFRGNLFQAMSQAMEEAMRSPVMLEWMKQSMDTASTWRKQWNDLLTRMRTKRRARPARTSTASWSACGTWKAGCSNGSTNWETGSAN